VDRRYCHGGSCFSREVGIRSELRRALETPSAAAGHRAQPTLGVLRTATAAMSLMSSAVAAESARHPGWNGTEHRRPCLGVGDGVPAGDGTLGDHIYPPMGARPRSNR